MNRPASASQVEVAAFAPVPTPLSYRLVGRSAEPGTRVLVPLGGRRVVGVVLSQGLVTGKVELRDVAEVLDVEPVFDAGMLSLISWVARYYIAPLGEVFRAALPSVLQAPERQYLRLTEAGEAALAAQRAILRPPGEDLDRRTVALLERLESSRAGLGRGRVGASPGLIGRLVDGGLVAQTARRAQPPAATIPDLVLEATPPDEAEAKALSRAPRQAALLEAVRQAGGRVRLGLLEGLPPQPKALAKKLADKGLLTIDEVEIPRDPFAAEPVTGDRPHEPTEEQSTALAALLAAVEAGQYAAFLLHGVTGSGKTEVYLQCIAHALARGRSALVLVPEIALTPQLAARFRARFGNRVAVLHSGLSDGERYDQWRLIRSGEVRIALGARSAVFAPLSDLGVVVVDEEHDGSFKQEEGVRYSARDAALVRAKQAGAVAILGSATPALESRHLVDDDRLTLLSLRNRATPRPLPEVQVIDLRRHSAGRERILSAPLADAIEQVLERGEQTILFLNRRGFSTFVICRACGHAFQCAHCSVSLTHHQGAGRLICHYCGFAEPPPASCPECGATEEHIGKLGLGTERVELYLQQRFPAARVARLDRDTATGKGLRRILDQVGRREIDILVGTQMVTKGHDFPFVTLVGVVCADLGLNFPDFRAAERTFQLLTQVAGRAGRGTGRGRVLIQTYSPEHPSIRHACGHDYDAFYAEECIARRELGYPPSGHLAAVRVDGRDADAVAARARQLATSAGAFARRERLEVEILGPSPAPIQRLKDRTRWLLMLKSSSRSALRSVLDGLAEALAAGGAGITRSAVDVDPISLL